VFGSLGLFIVPLGAEFGWDRAEVSLALTFFTIALVAALPLVGRLVDRHGAIQVLLPSVVVVGLGLAAIALVVDRLWRFYAVYLLLGCLGAGANSLAYVRVIVAWFDRRRGLALGLTIAGSGLGYAYVPPLLQHVIDGWGWRSGYLVLAAITLGVAAPVLRLVMRNTPAELGLGADGAAGAGAAQDAGAPQGPSRADAIRQRVFWQLALVFSVSSFCLYGLLAHLVPMLTDRGMAGDAAAFAAALLGVTITIARVAIGYLIDRVFAPRVALACFLAAAIGLGVLAAGASGHAAYGAAVLIGLALGVEMDLLAYLTSRYFGLRSFGAIYGLLFAAMLIGVSLGPIGYGAVFEATGAYRSILAPCVALLVLAAAAAGALPRFPVPAGRVSR
jgi:MFS family permease